MHLIEEGEACDRALASDRSDFPSFASFKQCFISITSQQDNQQPSPPPTARMDDQAGTMKMTFTELREQILCEICHFRSALEDEANNTCKRMPHTPFRTSSKPIAKRTTSPRPSRLQSSISSLREERAAEAQIKRAEPQLGNTTALCFSSTPSQPARSPSTLTENPHAMRRCMHCLRLLKVLAA